MSSPVKESRRKTAGLERRTKIMGLNNALFDKEERVISEGEALLRDGHVKNVPVPTYSGCWMGIKNFTRRSSGW